MEVGGWRLEVGGGRLRSHAVTHAGWRLTDGAWIRKAERTTFLCRNQASSGVATPPYLGLLSACRWIWRYSPWCLPTRRMVAVEGSYEVR